jgi:hypothetical protein
MSDLRLVCVCEVCARLALQQYVQWIYSSLLGSFLYICRGFLVSYLLCSCLALGSVLLIEPKKEKCMFILCLLLESFVCNGSFVQLY